MYELPDPHANDPSLFVCTIPRKLSLLRLNDLYIGQTGPPTTQRTFGLLGRVNDYSLVSKARGVFSEIPAGILRDGIIAAA